MKSLNGPSLGGFALWLGAGLLFGSLASTAKGAVRTLDATRFFLRSGLEPEWEEFAGKIPHGRRLDLHFDARTNATEATLFIRQSDVKLDWTVQLNGSPLGKLFLMEQRLVYPITIPPGRLFDGENTLSILPPKENDDILVGDFRLDERPLSLACESTLDMQVIDRESESGLPCRITIVDDRGALAPVYASTNQLLALRPGVVYTPDGKARIDLLPGRYTVLASRGFEYGLAWQRVSALVGGSQRLTLRLRREVATRGLASCDTHIHTYTYAKHGDATLEERILTLAGEGIKLPVSTEHNMLVDFAEPARRLGLQKEFTPILGCEVTTKSGHFNAFPFAPGSPVPDARLENWPELMQSIHSNLTDKARMIVLNHPRDVHNGFIPFAQPNFNAVTGQNRRGFEFGFNAVELINSGALRSDWMQVYHDWFGLLNYGYRITGVAGSDSHDVSRFIVGQGRTYIYCGAEDPGAIDIEKACRSLQEGRALVSLGLLTRMTVNGKFGVGDLATSIGKRLRINITASGPSWTLADRIELYANGNLIHEVKLPPKSTAGEKANINWSFLCPAHDFYLVAIASGPGVTSPHWAIPRPYQPSSKHWEPRVIGSTNPIWVDADGDGKFTPPRAYAEALVKEHGAEVARLLPALASYDQAVAAQAASICQAKGCDVRGPEFAHLLHDAPAPVQRGFAAFIASIVEAE